MRTTTCKACGASIVWIRTLAGKTMPCDAVPIPYKATKCGDSKAEKLVDDRGIIISGERVNTPDEATGAAYMPHWATCSAPDRFRRAKK